MRQICRVPQMRRQTKPRSPRRNGTFLLRAYSTACRTTMQHDPIWCLPDDLVHITIEMDAAAPSEEISADQRTLLISGLKAGLRSFEPFTVLCGSPIANRSGAVLDTHPDQGLTALQNLVRAALWQVHDSPAIAHDGGRGHASLGYAHGTADSDPLQPRPTDRVSTPPARRALDRPPDTRRWRPVGDDLGARRRAAIGTRTT